MKQVYDTVLRAPEGQTGGGAPVSALAPAAPAAPVAPAAPAEPAAPAAPAGDWLGKLEPEIKTWAESKGWKDAASADPAAIAQSYYNLEKLFGADKAGRTVQLPKDETDKAALNAIYDKLGRPKTSAEYEISLPEGADPAFATTARDWFHNAGLTKTQAGAVTESYRALELDVARKLEVQHSQEVEGLQKEWGGKFDHSVEVARSATKAAGLTDQDIKSIEMAVGPAKAAKMFEFYGRNYTEAGPPSNDTRGAPSFSGVTPAAAQQKIAQLGADGNFQARYRSNDPKVRAEAIQEMDNLHKLAVNAKVQ